MRIAYVSAEVHPFIKTGGLGDVAHSLPSALAALGIEPTVFVPRYRQVKQWLAANFAAATETVTLDRVLRIGTAARAPTYQLLSWHDRRIVFVVDDELYDRPHPYLDADGADYADSVTRWAYFARAILEYYRGIAAAPDIIHVNDWQAALIPMYLRTTDRANTPTLLTIHNVAYQGLFPAERIADAGLGSELLRPEGLEFFGKLNLLKGGLVFADALNTVSPTYAQEIRTEEYGKGLHGVLQAQRYKLSGILNGIDTVEWDPATDQHLAAHYDAADLGGKAQCKRALQERMRLPVRPESFLLGVISRFDLQKGIHLIVEAFRDLSDIDVQLVILGAGDPKIQSAVEDLVRAGEERVAALVGFDEALAHQIEAGADAFLMPSAFEPSGLNQMYSQRYGTTPIVRETGGLKDTVVDANPRSLAARTASGFSFTDFQASALIATIRRAHQLFSGKRDLWQQLRSSIMRIDHSWANRARGYADLYTTLASRRARS